MDEAVDITPLLRTKANWPKFWRGTVIGSNSEYVMIAITMTTGLVNVLLYHDSSRVALRLAKHGEAGEFVDRDTFDDAISMLVTLEPVAGGSASDAAAEESWNVW